jgi:hypothetical protein
MTGSLLFPEIELGLSRRGTYVPRRTRPSVQT